MFMAELKNQLLTAGHDFNVLQQPLRLDVANGSENYAMLNGREQLLKAGDMFVADQQGVISSIIYGPDRRTPITADTRSVLFVVYAPVGIGRERVEAHLGDIRTYVQAVCPEAKMTAMEFQASHKS
jgi:DNA/RNA-binding domain of Phe-tRNA-synthetase-like protein